MKAIILIMSALISSTFVLRGQDLRDKNDPGQDKESRELREKYNNKQPGLQLVPDQKKRDLQEEFNRRFNQDSSLTEHFPGASRYYAKRPTMQPYGKFIIEPDTSAKYYLIIVDPLRHTVRR